MKGLFGFLIVAMVMVCVSYANAQETKTAQDDTTAPKPKDVSIIVDRSPKVQELKVYEDGVLTHTMPISTGRETFDFNEGNYKINPYCSFTETNEEFAKTEEAKNSSDPSRFKVQRLREMNISDTWSGRDANGEITSKTRMPYATFFNGGTAFHAIDVETEYGKNALKKLGPKDNAANGGSGACVRLSPEHAKIVFDLFATKKTDGTYEKADPRTWDECKVAAGQNQSHKCTDPNQWPVPRIKQDVEIIVKDSRSTEEQAAAHKKCNDIKNAFLVDKAKCLEDKIRPQQSTTTAAQPAPQPAAQPAKQKKREGFIRKGLRKIGNFFSGKKEQEIDEATVAVINAPYDFKTSWEQLPPEERVKYNEECNREGHAKIKSGELKPLPSATSDATSVRPKKNPKAADGLWM